MKIDKKKHALIVLVAISFVLLASRFALSGPSTLKLDNAFITGRVIHLASPTTGIVEAVNLVRFGTLDYGKTAFLIGGHAAIDKVRSAQLLVRAAFVEGAQTCIRTQSQAEIVQTSSLAARLADERVADAKMLSDKGFFSQRQLEQLQFEQQKALEAIRVAQLEHRRLQMESSGSVPGTTKIVEAIEGLRLALIERRRSVVRLGSDVFVQDIKVLPGQWVQEGAELATIMPIDATRVQANVLETQIGLVSVGQAAEVRLDGVVGVLPGHVEAIVPATAATFSQVQRNTADSTWMKVSQRVPVVIRIDSVPAVSVYVGQSASVVLVPGKADPNSEQPRQTAVAASQPAQWDDVEDELQERLDQERAAVSRHLQLPASCALLKLTRHDSPAPAFARGSSRLPPP